MIEHSLVRATVIPEIVKLIGQYYRIDEEEGLRRFYESKTAEIYADDDTGLYGQSAVHLAGLFIVEMDGDIDATRWDKYCKSSITRQEKNIR
ncbi:MAG: hypothetical protein Q4G69_02980 [Planctomycetia bacterium]|nr:hypothetical protein [Planctomycetia bacterium]